MKLVKITLPCGVVVYLDWVDWDEPTDEEDIFLVEPTPRCRTCMFDNKIENDKGEIMCPPTAEPIEMSEEDIKNNLIPLIDFGGEEETDIEQDEH